MLRRNSSKSSRRKQLSRTKSTSSVYRNPVEDLQLFDPQVAERDAQIAARISYQRAHGRKMAYPHTAGGISSVGGTTTSSPKFERSRNSSRLMVRSEGAVSRQETCDIDETRRGLKHQKSIRFAGPTAKPRRNLASRATEPQVSTSDSTSRLSITGASLVAPPCTQSSLSSNRDLSYTLPSAMLPHKTVAEHVEDSSRAGGPSYTALRRQSVRQARKTRSMIIGPEYFDSLLQDSPGETKEEQPPTRSRYAALNKDKENERQTPAMESSNSLRAPKSMGFLRSRRNNSSSQSGDLAVQMARDKFKEQTETHSRLKSQPSIFFRSKDRRAESSMSFRKSLRNSSNTSAAFSAFSGNSLVITKEGGSLRKTARKVSRSLKTRLKGMFGRKSSESLMAARDSDEEDTFQMPVREDASMSRGPSRNATLNLAQPCQLIVSCEASIASCGDGEEDETEEPSGAEERSRVTSWTDSVVNTTMGQSVSVEWERQRLSVIRENGMHFSSPAINRTVNNRSAAIGHSAPVDSLRVYSALMKRAEEAKEKEDDSRRKRIVDIQWQGKAPPRGSSVDQLDMPAATIRCVQSDDGDVFEDKAIDSVQVNEEPSISMNRIDSPSDTHLAIPKEGDSPGWQSPGIAAYHQRRGDYDRTRIVDRSSAFFASPANHFFRAKSPFRRALQESMRATGKNAATTTGYLASLSELSLPTRKPSIAGSEKKENEKDAESIYSYNEERDDFQRGGADSRYLVDSFPKPLLSHSSTGISAHTDKSMVAPCLGQRPNSAASSVE